jgi:hypothetical protein
MLFTLTFVLELLKKTTIRYLIMQKIILPLNAGHLNDKIEYNLKYK